MNLKDLLASLTGDNSSGKSFNLAYYTFERGRNFSQERESCSSSLARASSHPWPHPQPSTLMPGSLEGFMCQKQALLTSRPAEDHTPIHTWQLEQHQEAAVLSPALAKAHGHCAGIFPTRLLWFTYLQLSLKATQEHFRSVQLPGKMSVVFHSCVHMSDGPSQVWAFGHILAPTEIFNPNKEQPNLRDNIHTAFPFSCFPTSDFWSHVH